jgi:hypothetical protein
MFSVLVLGLSLVHVSFINTLIGIGIFENEGSRNKLVHSFILLPILNIQTFNLLNTNLLKEFSPRELMCNMGDYSGPLDKFWAYQINTTLEYSNFGIYSVMWILMVRALIKGKQSVCGLAKKYLNIHIVFSFIQRSIFEFSVSSTYNVHLLKATSVIMAIILFGWVLQSQLSPRWKPYIQLSPEANFYYLVFLYIDTIIFASATNAIILYIFRRIFFNRQLI